MALGSGVLGFWGQGELKGEGRVFGERELEEGDVNGEEVERFARALQLGEFVRTVVGGVGFVMGVVGIWGDGA